LKILIAYRTKYGTAAACARTLLEKIGGDTVLADLADARDVNVREYDVVLVGGSIYGGKVQRTVVSFCERNRVALLQRKVGIYLCCLYQGEDALMQLQSAFPDWLIAHSFARALPGGEIHYAKLTLLDRLLVRGLPHPPGDLSKMKPAALEELAAATRALSSRG
jgi:menaquinone-dependent protoporphyrinogen oxidase